MTISGEARKALVSGLPSLRPAKLRLKDSMIELGLVMSPVVRCHWPMQGPQAHSSTRAPLARMSDRAPQSLSMVSTCREPGDTDRLTEG